MPDLEPIRSPESGPRPCVFEPPAWNWSKSSDTGWWVRADWASALLHEGRLPLDEWKRSGRLTTVKRGPHRVVYRADLAEGSVYVKHFLVPDFRAMARQWFRSGKGRNEGRRAAKLEAIGVPTITPVALGERRVRKFLLENYLVTKEIPDTVPLDEFVECRLPLIEPVRQGRLRRDLARVLADLTARLHDAGFVHQDFHPGNLLIRIEPDDTLRLAVIDLDALRVTRRLSWDGVRENLALLNHYFWSRCNRADRYRFLAAYLKARLDPSTPEPRLLSREIERGIRLGEAQGLRGRERFGEVATVPLHRGENEVRGPVQDRDQELEVLGPEPMIERLQRTAVFATADGYWQGMIHGRPIARVYEDLPPETQVAIKRESMSRLFPYREHAGYVLPMEAVIATIVKS